MDERSSLVCEPLRRLQPWKGNPNDHFMALPDIQMEPTRLTVHAIMSPGRAAHVARSADKRKNNVIEIRDEQPGDVDAVREVNRQAFDQEQEGRIVDAVRERCAAILSLVAVADGVVVGHIIFSPLTVGPVVGAALGPMAVIPAHQRQGIGGQLVTRGVERLRERGCPFIVVIGHPEFYPRFGFRSAAAQGLTCEWDVPAEAFMVNILNRQVGGSLRGRAQYREEFSTIE